MGLPQAEIPLALLLFNVGFVVATGCLHGVGIAIGLVNRWPHGGTVVRVAGGLVLLAGGGFLWQALA